MAASLIPNGAARLAKKIADAFRTSLSVSLRCEPSGVINGRMVAIIATFFHPERSGFVLAPLVKSEECPGFELALSEDIRAGARERTFSAVFDSSVFQVPSGDVTLTLEPRSGQPAIASTTLHVFNTGDIAEAERVLSESEA